MENSKVIKDSVFSKTYLNLFLRKYISQSSPGVIAKEDRDSFLFLGFIMAIAVRPSLEFSLDIFIPSLKLPQLSSSNLLGGMISSLVSLNPTDPLLRVVPPSLVIQLEKNADFEPEPDAGVGTPKSSLSPIWNDVPESDVRALLSLIVSLNSVH